MLSSHELKTAFVELLGEENTEWQTHPLVVAWTRRVAKSFEIGFCILKKMEAEGTVITLGQRVTLASRELEVLN